MHDKSAPSSISSGRVPGKMLSCSVRPYQPEPSFAAIPGIPPFSKWIMRIGFSFNACGYDCIHLYSHPQPRLNAAARFFGQSCSKLSTSRHGAGGVELFDLSSVEAELPENFVIVLAEVGRAACGVLCDAV